jgi:aminoglycoside phosphotransferase (APT) family kinase protein
MGGMNYHIEIKFEDGISWLARIRRFNATSPPPDLQHYIMRSEVATLQFLSKTNVPSPRVFDYNFETANCIGVEYILMEKLPGKSLGWSLTTPEQRKKIISQLADIYVELKAFPFDSMGSLEQPGTDHVGPFARVINRLYELTDASPWPFHLSRRIHRLELTINSRSYHQGRGIR